VRVAERDANGAYAWSKPLALPAPGLGGKAHPAGLCLGGNGVLWVTSTRGNCVYGIDTKTGASVANMAVGIAPYTICFTSPEKAYVSNWGGDAPTANDAQAPTSGAMARVDPRTSVVNDGSVAVLTQVQGKWACSKSVKVGLHPCALLAGAKGKRLYVANACSDTVSVIDTATDAVVETIDCRPERKLPFGSGSNALALSADGGTLYVANGTNNCVAVVNLGENARETPVGGIDAKTYIKGLIPTGWYPSALALSADGKKLYVANLKGHGNLAELRAKEKGKTSGDYLGSVSLIDIPDAQRLATYTNEVNENNRLAQSLSGLEPPRTAAQPVPVPERHGEPSVFKHVIYIVKENKTYDQVFGDMKEGDGDKSLCIFPEEITPNAHALARAFTLFDNFYCSGAKSPDGHAWVDQAYVTDYLERAYGGFARSYPFEGSDPLAFAGTGFVWDNALAHGRSFRNYGEFCKTSYVPKASWKDVYDDFKNGTNKIQIAVEPNMQSLKAYSHPGYPGFPLHTPDVLRAKLFVEELQRYEKTGGFPNLLYVFLPQNHTSGTTPGYPTPRAMVADNDLALGQIVAAVSQSTFWPQTCIFVVEDDPQSGYDHVDGHRTVALVVSPYTRRKFVDHSNYTQPGMVKTIELILGLPPMTQLDLAAPAMRGCFQTQADRTPFASVPARVALDEMNPPLGKLKGAALKWATKSLALSFQNEDEADDDDLNRIVWHAMRGDDTPYPAAFANDHDDD
jgi:YVTN family beta-propeller protein